MSKSEAVKSNLNLIQNIATTIIKTCLNNDIQTYLLQLQQGSYRSHEWHSVVSVVHETKRKRTILKYTKYDHYIFCTYFDMVCKIVLQQSDANTIQTKINKHAQLNFLELKENISSLSDREHSCDNVGENLTTHAEVLPLKLEPFNNSVTDDFSVIDASSYSLSDKTLLKNELDGIISESKGKQIKDSKNSPIKLNKSVNSGEQIQMVSTSQKNDPLTKQTMLETCKHLVCMHKNFVKNRPLRVKIDKFPIKGESFELPKKFWEENWTNGNQLLTNWTDDFNDVFETIVAYEECVLSFIRHVVNPVNKSANYEGERVWFSATAKSKNSFCAKFKFLVICNCIKPFHDTTVCVFQSSQIHHNEGENHRRNIKGKKRKRLAAELEANPPSIKKLKMLGKVSCKVIKAGNLNNAPDRELLCKISSENNTKFDVDKDFTIFMWKLIKKYNESWKGDIFNGYVQMYCEYPFYIILMNKAILKHALLARYRPLFLYLDATGTIIKNPPRIKSKVFNYCYVLPGGRDYSPLVIAEFISSAHAVKDISIFTHMFAQNLLKLSTRRPIVDKIETDFSLALIQSNCLSFNGFKLSVYLHQMYEEVILKKAVSPLTILHICSSHFIHTCLKKIEEYIDDNDLCSTLLQEP